MPPGLVNIVLQELNLFVSILSPQSSLKVPQVPHFPFWYALVFLLEIAFASPLGLTHIFV